MEEWKAAQLSYLKYFNINYFAKNRLKNLLFPLNFNNYYFYKLSNKSQVSVKSIEKNIFELMVLYFKMHKLYKTYKDDDLSKYSYLLKTELEHFILRYRLVVSKLESLMFEFKKLGAIDINLDYFLESEEYKQLLGIRNDIAHESIRSHVFYSERIVRESFQFYTNRSLDNNINLHEVFLNPYGSEIYDLKRWITWMLVLLFCFMEDIVNNIVNYIKNEYDMDNYKFHEIEQYDNIVAGRLSTLVPIDDEVSLIKCGIEELAKYICEY